MPKRKATNPGGGANTQPRKSARLKDLAPVQVESLIVSWSPFKRTKTEVSFHVITTLTLNRNTPTEVRIIQYVRDGCSIQAGAGPEFQYKRTQFRRDHDETLPITGKIYQYDDKPGYDVNHGITEYTDMKYVFGAKWKIMHGDDQLTETTPLFGWVEGLFPRNYNPNAPVNATWNANTRTWQNAGTLSDQFPPWGQYPVPPTDNT